MTSIAARMARHRTRLTVTIATALAALVASAGPAAADPPASSGVVERFVAQEFLLFPDFEHGLAVYVNITKEEVCTGTGGPQADWNFLLIASPSSAELIRVQAPDQPIYLHRITGETQGPCDPNIEDEPAFVGTVDVVLNDNELCPCQNNRTNSFGDRGHGVVYDTDGGAWHYSWTWRAQINEQDEFRVVTETYVLHPVGG
ncbi:MAG TPA: hypothetical protein VFZ41_02760 [Solirubrobacterales bacterium]